MAGLDLNGFGIHPFGQEALHVRAKRLIIRRHHIPGRDGFPGRSGERLVGIGKEQGLPGIYLRQYSGSAEAGQRPAGRPPLGDVVDLAMQPQLLDHISRLNHK